MQVTRRQHCRQWSPISDSAQAMLGPVAASAETGPAEKEAERVWQRYSSCSWHSDGRFVPCRSELRLYAKTADSSARVRPASIYRYGRLAAAVWRHALVGGFRYPRAARGPKCSSPARGVCTGRAMDVLLPGQMVSCVPAVDRWRDTRGFAISLGLQSASRGSVSRSCKSTPGCLSSSVQVLSLISSYNAVCAAPARGLSYDQLDIRYT